MPDFFTWLRHIKFFFSPHLRIYLISEGREGVKERRREREGERERERQRQRENEWERFINVREKHWLASSTGCLLHVSWLGVEPAIQVCAPGGNQTQPFFGCIGQHSNQFSHPAKVIYTFFFIKRKLKCYIPQCIWFKIFPLSNIMMHAVNMQLHLIQYN